MIKTIIFDLNKVLVTHEDTDLNTEYLETLGIEQKVFWKTANNYIIDYFTGKINLDELLEKTLKNLKLNSNLTEKTKQLHEKGITLVPGIKEILNDLHKSHNLVLLAGDGKDSLELKLNKFNLKKYFNKIYATCYEGITKESPEIYKKILAYEKTSPSEVLFIDDMALHIEIAKNLGINTIHFKNSTDLREKLADFSIQVN